MTAASALERLDRKSRLRVTAESLGKRGKEAWLIYRRNWMAVLGVALLLLFSVMALAHPFLMGTV